MGSENYELESKKCHLQVLSVFFFFILESSDDLSISGWNRFRFLTSAPQEQFPAERLPSTHHQTACRSRMACLLPCGSGQGDRPKLVAALTQGRQMARK